MINYMKLYISIHCHTREWETHTDLVFIIEQMGLQQTLQTTNSVSNISIPAYFTQFVSLLTRPPLLTM